MRYLMPQALLEEIAQEGGGKYFNGANTKEVLDALQKALDTIEKNEYCQNIHTT